MWYDIQDREKLFNNNSLGIAINQDKEKRIFLLDGPSGCGKTDFINHFAGGKMLRVPSNLIKETVFYSNDIRYNMELMLYFLTQLNLDIMCIEDIDITIERSDAVQELFANIVSWLSKRYKVLLTGIEISRVNKTFMECLPDQYRYFMHSDTV